ncbi:MAG: DUF805 domain-containing protein [Planctomycetota bacterium]
MWRHPQEWFRLRGTVGRRDYAIVGFTLALLKYAVEAAVALAMTGRWMRPWEAVNPWLDSRVPFLNDAPVIAILWLLFTLPFVAISVSMSARRAADAGWSPWLGLVMLIPLVNLIAIVVLLIPAHRAPTPEEESAEELRQSELIRDVYQPPAEVEQDEEFDNTLIDDPEAGSVGAILSAIGIGCATQVVVGLLSVWVLREYGFLLFFSAPVVAGATSGFTFNASKKRGFGKLIGVIFMMNVVSYGVMLCIGLDGAICLAMAFPLLFPLSVFGGVVGGAIATAGMRPGRDERLGMYSSMLLLPIALVLEPLDKTSTIHSVRTSVVIDAPPEEVWNTVIAFPEIDSEPAWFFKLGIAAPMRATIVPEEGAEVLGEGACRYCEFTTGPFVEPVTTWRPPTASRDGLLAFDVVEQPLPMEEWTPFSGLHPPHLDDGFVSHRGQFELEHLPDGSTRLTGTTWYSIDVRPRMYWRCWADPVIGAIHLRVLEHIRDVCQAESSERGHQASNSVHANAGFSIR